MAETKAKPPDMPLVTDVKPSIGVSTEILTPHTLYAFYAKTWQYINLPKGFIGLKHLRREVDAKSLDDILTFKLDRAGCIYLAYPAIVKPDPPWVLDYARRSEVLRIEEVPFDWKLCYRVIRSAGYVSLYSTTFLVSNVKFPFLVFIGPVGFITAPRK